MNCRAASRWMPLYVGGDLVERRAERLRAHVANCEACREELRGYELSRQTLFSLKAGLRTGSPDLWPAIRAGLHLIPPPRRTVPWRTVAAAALLLLGGFLAVEIFHALPPGGTGADSADLESAVFLPPAAVAIGRGAYGLGGVAPRSDSGYDDFPAVRSPDPGRLSWDEF